MRIFLLLSVATLAAAAAKHKPVQIEGIKTPGIQIPLISLKSDVDIPAPAKPSWLFFSGSVFFPNAADGLDRVDVKTGKPAAPVPGIAKPCSGMAVGFGSLWVPSCKDGSLVRLDTKTYKETAKFQVGTGSAHHAIAAGTDSIWMLTDDKATLSRIDPDQNAVVGELRVPPGCRSLAFGETALWLACPAENKIYRINPATNLVANQVEVSGQPESVAIGEGSVWVYCRKDGKVDRIDPKTNKVIKSLELGVRGAEGQIAVGEGSVWVTMTGFPITRINPLAEKEAVAQQFFGPGGGAVETSAGALWLSHVAEGKVLKFDPKRITATLAE